jgi:hypothetical protein
MKHIIIKYHNASNQELKTTSDFPSTLKIAAILDFRRSIRAALFFDITSPLISSNSKTNRAKIY